MTTSPTPDLSPPSSSRQSTAFRFKRKHLDDPSASDEIPSKRRSHSPPSSHKTHRHRYHHRRHHRSRHNRPPPSPPPIQIDPETAFRESLFDALADDEGAAFWESVYGQPIHTYSPYIHSSTSSTNNPEDPPLERMTDDEYASYVRARMWEKSHGYIIEERRRREEEHAKRRKREEEGRTWERGVEEALRRGEERRRRSRWRDAWGRYTKGWERLISEKDAEGRRKDMRDRVPWPVESGRYTDVGDEEVVKFFKRTSQTEGSNQEADLGKILKVERVRWHPDKFIRRAGSQAMDKETIGMVTAVFQIVDRLWSETRPA